MFVVFCLNSKTGSSLATFPLRFVNIDSTYKLKNLDKIKLLFFNVNSII